MNGKDAREGDDAGVVRREFEVGVEGMAGRFEHITVTATSPERAYRDAEREVEKLNRYDLTDPVNAYQAFEIGEGVTHERR